MDFTINIKGVDGLGFKYGTIVVQAPDGKRIFRYDERTTAGDNDPIGTVYADGEKVWTPGDPGDTQTAIGKFIENRMREE